MQIPEDLAVPERIVWDAIEAGEWVSLLVDGSKDEQDPENGAQWGPERTIRAEALIAMLTSMPASSRRRARAIRIRMARISGALDLEGVELPCPLVLDTCYFQERVNLNEARAPKIELTNAHLPAFAGRQLRTEGDVSLAGSQTVLIDLGEAQIDGRLILTGAQFKNHSETVLYAGGAQIGGNVFCDDLRVEGELSLTRAHIGGQLNFCNAQLKNPGGRALRAEQLQVEDGVFFQDGFKAEGEIRILGARIGGQLCLDGAELKNPDGIALCADRVEVERGMFCVEKFTVEGAMRLLGAHIAGQLSLNGAKLKNPGGVCLGADGARIDEDMFCQQVEAEGNIRIFGAHIKGQLNLKGAQLKNPGGDALTGIQVIIEEDLLCANVSVVGNMDLSGSHINGLLDLKATKLSNPNKSALDLANSKIEHLHLPAKTAPEGTVDLRHARVTHLEDAWPTTKYAAFIGDLVYETLSPLDGRVEERLEWVANSEGEFRPQPYEHLASVLRRAGHDADARTVSIAKEKARNYSRTWPSKLWSTFLGRIVGYGYKPGQGLWWLAGLVGADYVVFKWAKAAHQFHAIRDPTQTPPQFHLSLYALDHVLPLIELGQRSYWSATGAFQYWQTFSDLAGWLLVTVILGAVTSRLVRS